MVAQQQSLLTLNTPDVAGNDPYWWAVVLLMSFNGADGSFGSPGFTDESPAVRGTGTRQGTAAISTAQSKFGGASLATPGGASGITFPDSPDWDFGTGPFTVEGYFRFTSTPTNALLLAQWGSGWAFYFETGNLKFRSGSIVDTTAFNYSPPLNQWLHIACDRDSASTCRVYVDGVMKSKTLNYTPNLAGSSAVLMLCTLNPGGFGGYDVVGFSEEIRVTNGVARYGNDAGYALDNAPFPRAGSPVDMAGVWRPSMLSSLRLWLKGDSLTGSAGSAITTWVDSSGRNNHATGVGGPAVRIGPYNLPVVKFTAASLQYFTLPDFLTGFTAGSVIFVVKLNADPPSSGGVNDAGVTKFGADTSNNADNHYPYAGDSNIYDDFGSTSRRTIGNPTPSMALWHIASFHAAANDMRFYINAVQFFSTTSNTVGWRTQPLIGRGAKTGSENYLDGLLAELVFVNEVLSDTNRQALEGYLAWKWGIQSSLPVGHPYKVAAP